MSQTLKSGAGFKQTYAVPANLYKMIKIFFKDLSMADKKFTHKFTNRYPFFKTTNDKT